MNKTKKISSEEEQEDLNKVVPITKLATKREDPPWGDWLSGLEIGTIFLCQAYTPYLQEWIVRNKSERAVLLEGPDAPAKWVDPVRFSDQFQLYEILETEEERWEM